MLWATCATAGASRGHIFAGSFGSAGSGAGQLKEPSGVAVDDATGDVYVVEKGNNRVQRFSAAGAIQGEFNGSGSLTGEGTAAGGGGRPGENATGRFSAPEGIAIDNTCRRHEEGAGTPLSPSECEALDPSNGDVYVMDSGHKVIDKYTAAGKYVAQLTETSGGVFAELLGVGVDAAGTVWVYEGKRVEVETGKIDSFNDEQFNKSQATVASKASTFPEPGFAVDGHDRLYVVHRLAKVVAQLNTGGAVVRDEVNGAAATTGVGADTASDEAFIDTGQKVSVYSSAGTLLETLGTGQLVGGTAIGVDGSSETAYVADSGASTIEIFAPKPITAPTVDSQSVSTITASTALLSAEINPHGAASSYRFEYGRCATPSSCVTSAYEASVPPSGGALGATFEVEPVSAGVEGLASDTTYHFRVAASNSHGTAEGVAEQIFTTQGSGGFALPDGRGWELVSPPEKHGALLEAIGEAQITQAADSGAAMTYVSAAPTGAEPAGFSNKVQVLSTRGAGGWSSRDIAPPHDVASGLSQSTGQEYRAFSEDLSRAVVQPFGPFIPASSSQALAPGVASEQTAFLRAVLGGGDGTVCTSGCYEPLVTAAPGHANVPEPTQFGQLGAGEKPCPPEVICGPRFVAATPDLSHVVVESFVALTGPISHDVPDEDALYEWTAGRLQPVSITPGEEAAGGRPKIGRGGQTARGAISAEGTRVVFSESEGHLYLRDMTLEKTVQLDAVQGGTGANAPAAAFQFASSDGSRVFFTDSQRLTTDSGGGSGGSHKEDDLYECEIVVVGAAPTCALTDLTPKRGAESAHVLDDVLGASSDGSYVYFVANGKLASGAIEGDCAGLSSVEGARCNLYVAHFDGAHWTTSLVAVLSSEDYPDWNGNAAQSFLAGMTSRVSPNGQWLAFMSREGLTGYDTRDAVNGKPAEEVYLYDAPSATLACASCNPTGARPRGVEYGQLHFGLDGNEIWKEDRMLAASVPAWTSYSGGSALYQSRYLSDDGRLFFNASDALVSQDQNGTGDVYEYEPAAGHAEDGRCGPAAGAGSNASKPAHRFAAPGGEGEEPAGCVGLISSGASAEESGFLDASESGGDVFFLTAEKLTKQDIDTSLDVYDAHECTASSPCTEPQASPPPPCDAVESCRPSPAPTPPIFGPPASATLSGVGNLTPAPPPAPKAAAKPPTRAQLLAKALQACKKKRGAKRKTCEATARRKYGPPKKKQKSRKSSASRAGAKR